MFVVSQAFVEFEVEGAVERWVSYEDHGHRVPVHEVATCDLLSIADDTAIEGLADLRADLNIAGFKVARWTFLSAPRRIELDDELGDRLLPLERD